MNAIRPPRFVAPFFGCAVAAILIFLPAIATTAATNTITAFGLTFQAHEGASLTLQEDGLYVWNGQPVPPISDWGEGETPEPTNWFGARVFLGEAQQGVFGYPGADFENEFFSMDATAYGSINGQPSERVSYVRGTCTSYATYLIDVDLSALGASRFAFAVYDGDQLLYNVTNDCGECPIGLTAYFGNTWWASPRVNPYWKEACGDVGVLVEFDQHAEVTLYGVYVDGGVYESSSYASRIFIQAVNPTYTVDYLSHVDVRAGGNLPSFSIMDARLGMFHRAHKAIGDVVLDARAGRLMLTNILYVAPYTNGVEPPEVIDTGVAIELDNGRWFGNFGYIELLDGAGRFDLNLEPVDLSVEDSWVYLTSNGIERQGEGLEQGNVLGAVRLHYMQGALYVQPELATDSVLWSFYNQGQFVGSILEPASCAPPVTGNPRLIGCAVNANSMSGPAAYTMRFDQPATLFMGVTMEGVTNIMTGDEIRMGAVNTGGDASNAAPVASFQSFVLLARNTPSLTITNETQERALLEVPALTIEQIGNSVLISWLDPNRVFFLESAATTSGPFFWVEAGVNYNGNISSVTVPVTPQNQIFRLNAHQIRRPRPGVD